MTRDGTSESFWTPPQEVIVAPVDTGELFGWGGEKILIRYKPPGHLDEVFSEGTGVRRLKMEDPQKPCKEPSKSRGQILPSS